MKISFEGKTLRLGDRTIEFEARVAKLNRYGDLLFVRLDDDDYSEQDEFRERNIVAVDADGNIRWRIDRPPSAPTRRGKRWSSAYVGIDPDTGKEDRPVVAYDIHGACWKVDPETGKVSDPIFTK